jgi:hypothetical protein
MRSWKTTLAGIAGILIAGGTAINFVLAGDFASAIAAASVVPAAIGLLFARDNNVTSEDVGAK